MNDFKFIELPKEEVLSEVELSFIEGATNCTNYTACTDPDGGKSNCGTYNGGSCGGVGGCGPVLFCSNYSF